MSTEKKLKFQVVYFSSEDPEYPASQLNTVNPSTKGWMSLRFCDFPQELGFELLDGVSNIRQIQVLNHQCNIASKIELFVGMGNDYDTATFKRLGYMSIDSNERSNYQARELKTVFVDSYGKFIKLLLNENHVNHLNNYNQVGIIALNLTGFPDHDSKIQTPIAKIAGEKPLLAKPINRNPYSDLSADINLDPHTAGKLRLLAEAKNNAVKNEDYLMAKQIKAVESELKQLGSRLGQLELAKTEAVAAEDYDLAKDIKDQCDELKKDIARKINAIEIPGVRLTTPAPVRQAPRFAPAKDDDNGYEDEIIVKKNNNTPFLNVDDLPVGGGGGNGKKVAKVEAFHHPSFDEDMTGGGGDGGHSYDPQDDVYSQHSVPLDGDDRPIRPKPQTDYNDRDPTIEESEGGMGTGMPKESFPVGEHPLEGVPGFLDLPTPEPLSIKSREYCEQHGIIKLVGEYRARCLFSKSWNLREALILKTEDLLKTEFVSDIINTTPALCAILKQGVEDKMQQVMFTSMNLLDSILKAVKSGRTPKSIVVPAFDPVITQFIEKLSDGNARQRECARKGLDILAASGSVGPHAVSSHLVRPLPPKQKTAWRPIASRLEVLAALVSTFHLNSQSGLNMDSMLNFAKTAQAFTHSHNEVRDNAKKLVVAIHKEVGTAPLEPTLALLRKKQREEYEAAFVAEAKGEGAGARSPPPAASAPAPGKKAPASSASGGEKGGPGNGASPKRTDKSHQHAPHNPAGKVPTSQAKVESQSHGYEPAPANGEEKQDYSSCMFCGMSNKKWNENDLDLHYWKDCPLLISCPSCTQIVEIAGLPEHLLDECEAKDDYVPCDVTGLAIRKTEFAGWKKSPLCVPAPENFMYCPLCLSTVEDSDQAWLTHLTKKCAKNTRIESH